MAGGDAPISEPKNYRKAAKNCRELTALGAFFEVALGLALLISQFFISGQYYLDIIIALAYMGLGVFGMFIGFFKVDKMKEKTNFLFIYYLGLIINSAVYGLFIAFFVIFGVSANPSEQNTEVVLIGAGAIYFPTLVLLSFPAITCSCLYKGNLERMD